MVCLKVSGSTEDRPSGLLGEVFGIEVTGSPQHEAVYAPLKFPAQGNPLHADTSADSSRCSASKPGCDIHSTSDRCDFYACQLATQRAEDQGLQDVRKHRLVQITDDDGSHCLHLVGK